MTEIEILPVFVVTGVNWTCEVVLDEFNAQFDKPTQLFEAASRAVEAYEHGCEGCEIVLNPDSRGEKLQLGVVVLVHAKGENPEHSEEIPTYLCYADNGDYKEADRFKLLFDKQIAALDQTQAAGDKVKSEEQNLKKKIKQLRPKKKK